MTDTRPRQAFRSLGRWLGAAAAWLVVLEPIWMLRVEDVIGRSGGVEVQGPPRGVTVPSFQRWMEQRVCFSLSGL